MRCKDPVPGGVVVPQWQCYLDGSHFSVSCSFMRQGGCTMAILDISLTRIMMPPLPLGILIPVTQSMLALASSAGPSVSGPWQAEHKYFFTTFMDM